MQIFTLIQNNTNEKGFYEVIKNLGRGAFGSV